MAYLSELHPEIYMTPPRAGGVANIVPVKSSKEPRLSTASGKGSKVSKSMADKTSMVGKASVRSTTSGKGSIKSGVGSTFEASFLSSSSEKNSREYRINQVLHTSRWMLPEMCETDADQNIPMPSFDPVNSAMTLLCITISTIMLMAAGHKDVSKDHLKWTLSYLECIKDEFGNHPPNVIGMMNQIKLIDSNLESFLETELADKDMDGADGIIEEEKPKTTTTTTAKE